MENIYIFMYASTNGAVNYYVFWLKGIFAL